MSEKKSITEKRRRPMDKLAYFFIFFFAFLVFAMVLLFVVYILYNGIPGLTWEFLTTAPNPIEQTIGILPSIINTGYMILLAILFAVPIGVGGAIYLCEYAKNKRLIRIIEFTTETLSGIPSIIFGVFGYVFFCTLLNLKVSLLSGALTLTIIVLPTIIRTTGEALKAVPNSYREAAMGIGATKWYMIHTVLLPSASRGIITAVILAVGRIVGESAALILVAGGSAMYMPRGNFFQQIMSSGATLSVELYRYAYSRGENGVGFSIAVVLLAISVLLNILVKLINKKLGTQKTEN
ncbi:MAG: phosphate ABC transporter permease PstA [Clostridiales bacterium]|nr:phosphate ABC transporter permease PstA [Clostridiales bacterium]